MASGASHKGNRTARPYGLILVLAFGVSLLGVMVIHNHRVTQRHMFNLVKEKDSLINSLQLLLQKERDHSKEMKRKSEEMKARIYSLRARIYSLRIQRMSVENRPVELQSRIESMQDEQRTKEVALEEKQNKITRLKERDIESGRQNAKLLALMESLTQKEAEIEDLKHRLESSVKLWSLSTDDHPSKNLTNGRSKAMDEKNENKSAYVRGSLNSSGNAAADNRSTITDPKGTIGEQKQSVLAKDGVTTGGENGIERQGKKNLNSRGREGGVIEEEKNVTNAAEAAGANGNDTRASRSEEASTKSMDDEGVRQGEFGNFQGKTRARHR